MVFPILNSMASLISFYNMATPVLKSPFNFAAIQKARKLNRRAKAQKRGVPTAGGNWDCCYKFYSSNKPYINPARDIKRNCNWKAKRKQLKRERRLCQQ